MLECLPLSIAETILLSLSSRDIARAVLACPSWQQILTTKRFIRRHRGRFIGLDGHVPLDVTLRQHPNKNIEPRTVCQELWSKTLSNHCVACLLDPLLLTKTHIETRCACVDHLEIHGSRDQIIWGVVPWHETPRCQEWPLFYGYKPRVSRLIRQRRERTQDRRAAQEKQ